MKTAQPSVEVNEETIAIDRLFQRISLNNEKSMERYLQYELASFLLSLFTENYLRQNVISPLYGEFTNAPTHSNGIVYAMDGSFHFISLLDRKRIHRKRLEINICSMYQTITHITATFL